MKKHYVLIAVLVLIFVILGIVILVNWNWGEKLIGGDKDKHGCLIGAGYSWNEGEKSCVRQWSNESDRYQINSFYACEQAGYPVMESYPRQCRALNGSVFAEEIH